MIAVVDRTPLVAIAVLLLVEALRIERTGRGRECRKNRQRDKRGDNDLHDVLHLQTKQATPLPPVIDERMMARCHAQRCRLRDSFSNSPDFLVAKRARRWERAETAMNCASENTYPLIVSSRVGQLL